MILLNLVGLGLYLGQETVHKFLIKLIIIFMWQVVIMALVLVLETLFGEQIAIKASNRK